MLAYKAVPNGCTTEGHSIASDLSSIFFIIEAAL